MLELDYGYAICTDINLSPEDLTKVNKVRERAIRRSEAVRNITIGIYLREQRRRSHLVGGERQMLERIASKYLDGKDLSIDALFENGINVAAVVDSLEYLRIFKEHQTFTVTYALHLPTQTPLIGQTNLFE